jgi:aminocarboxymuconate-semialdehyde decarboxylase
VTGPAGPRYVDLAARLEAMDEQGVAMHALSLSQPMVYWAGRRLGEQLAALFNEELARAHESAPQRFVGLATLPMHEPELAVRELERAAELPGVCGVYVATRILQRELSDEAFFPVYERLEALGLPLFLHPVLVVEPERLQRFYLTNLLGNPFESAIAAAHLIFGGVLDRFPALEVVLPHAGGAFPWIAGRLNRGWEKREELRKNCRSPLQYLRRFHYDTIGYSDKVIEYLARIVGPDRIVMGSDYCFPIAYERPVDVVRDNRALSEDERRLILEANARRLLRIS